MYAPQTKIAPRKGTSSADVFLGASRLGTLIADDRGQVFFHPAALIAGGIQAMAFRTAALAAAR